MLIWKAVDKQDLTYASISVYRWEMSRCDNLSASTVVLLAYHVDGCHQLLLSSKEQGIQGVTDKTPLHTVVSLHSQR